MCSNSRHLFVYGTLMSGYINHYYLRGYDYVIAQLVGYRRVWSDIWGFPIILKDDKEVVTGELYFDVSDETLARVDRLENIPYMYKRIVVKVFTQDNNEFLANVYYPTDEWIERYLRT